MPERKRRNEVLDPTLPDFENDLLEDESVEVGSGCSISLDYSEEAPTVYVKTYGELDRVSLRRKIEEHYPGAKIEGLTPKISVRVRAKRRTKPKSKKPMK